MKKITTLLLTLVLAMVATAAFAQEEQMLIKLGSAVTELETDKQYVMQNVLTGYYIYPMQGATEGANLWSSDFALKGLTEEEAQDFFITLEAVDADNLVFNIKFQTSGLYLNLGEPDGFSTLTAEPSTIKFFPIDGTDNVFSMSESELSINYFFTWEAQENPCQTIQLSMTGEEITLPGYQYKFYTVELVPESEFGPFPYEFINTQWTTPDGGRLDKSNITYDEENNTITLKANEAGQDDEGNISYKNNAALGNSTEYSQFGGITTEDYYTTLDQQWLVVVGTDLSTEVGDSYLWWLNGANSQIPHKYAVTLEDGRVLITWDVTETGIDTRLRDETNLQDGWTCFGLTPLTEDGTTTISDISFYTWDEAVAKYPKLEEAKSEEVETVPFEFVCTQWVSGDYDRLWDDNIVYDEENNTITAKANVRSYDDEGNPLYTNNIGLGNSTEHVAYEGITTSGYYTTLEQNWFVVVGTDLSLVASDSYLWWLNGGNNGTQYPATYSVTLEDGRVLIAWDVTKSDFDDNLQKEKNTANGWTDFGVTPINGTSTISDICFYTWKEAATKYPELEEVGGGADGPVPYEFVNTNWVTTDLSRLSQDQISYDENENSIAMDVEGQNNVALGNSNQQAQWSGITTMGFYVTNEQNWFVVMGEGLAVGEGDSYMWWLNGANYNTQVVPTIMVRNEYSAVFAWDVNETGLDENLLEEENTLNGWTAFGLTSLNGSGTVIYDISFYTWDEAVAKYPELEKNENLQALLNTYAADVAKVEELIDDLEGQLEEGVEDPDREDALYYALEVLYVAESDYGYEDTTLSNDAAVEELKVAIEALEAAIAATETLSTSVSNIVVNTRESDAIYTLSGVRVQKAVKGVYIVNGKKVLVK